MENSIRKENRKYQIIYPSSTDPFTYLCYKEKTCKLGIGSSDKFEIFRFGKTGDDFFVLEYNERLGYAGFELISKDMELIQDVFIQNIDEFTEESLLKKDFFSYSRNYQAKILARWIQ